MEYLQLQYNRCDLVRQIDGTILYSKNQYLAYNCLLFFINIGINTRSTTFSRIIFGQRNPIISKCLRGFQDWLQLRQNLYNHLTKISTSSQRSMKAFVSNLCFFCFHYTEVPFFTCVLYTLL